MASGLEIVAVPAFADNYLWLVRDPDSDEVAVVDPGDATPVLAEASRRGWRIGQVWNTHWHLDHTGGNAEVIAATGASLSLPAAEADRIAARADVLLAEGDSVRLGAHVGEVWEVPGHTLGHLALVFHDDGVAFVGDTMFVMGCGRLFEGTPAQMHASLQRLATLPDATSVYCAHEYSLSNARFAAHIHSEDAAVADRLAAIEARRAAGKKTVPTSIALERATNPFLRVASSNEFAQLRMAKDRFS